ncbi:hypothetical protein BH11BAC1_BH11BAC1_04040 [soil metagenome]
MPKKLLIVFLLFISRQVFSQTIDSVKVAHCKYFYAPTTSYGNTVDSFDTQKLIRNSWMYDSLWQPVQRTIFTYSGSGQMVHKIEEENSDTAWAIFQETFNSYNNHDSLVENKWFYYYYTAGLLSSTYGRKTKYLYDTLLHNLTRIDFNYIDSIASWDTSYFNISNFDSLNRIALQEFYYRGPDGNFHLSNTYDFFYLPGGLLDYRINLNSNSMDKYQYTYYPAGYLYQMVQNSWNYQTQQWFPRIIEEYYYDSSFNLIAHSNNLIIDSMLAFLDSSSCQYDEFNNQVSYMYQSNTGGGNEGTFMYDSLQILAHSHQCSWNHGDGLSCQDCDYSYFKGPFNQGLMELSQRSIAIYPNPAEYFFMITGNWNRDENISLKIYNTLGKEIEFFVEKVSVGFKVDISFLNHGIYFVNISDKNQSYTEKLVVF